MRHIDPERDMDMRKFKFFATVVAIIAAFFVLKTVFGLLAAFVPLIVGAIIGSVVTYFCMKLKEIDLDTLPSKRDRAA